MIAILCLIALLIAKSLPIFLYSSLYARGEFLNSSISIIITVYLYLYYFFKLYNKYYFDNLYKKALKIDISYLIVCITIILGIRYYSEISKIEHFIIRITMYSVIIYIIRDLYKNIFIPNKKQYGTIYIIFTLIQLSLYVSLILFARISNIYTINYFYKYIIILFSCLAFCEIYISRKKEYWFHRNNFIIILKPLLLINFGRNYEEIITNESLNLEIRYLLKLSFIRRIECKKLENRFSKQLIKCGIKNKEPIFGEFKKHIWSFYMKRQTDKWFIPSIMSTLIQNLKRNGRRKLNSI